jgi:glycosyltransferase involved in cell wall biosynthesis
MARRLLMTAFGWNDSGGGTTVPRLAAKELARRGWDVTVFHAAVAPAPAHGSYHVAEWEEDGVRLLGVHNRRHGLWDKEAPLRELDDPPITAAFAAALDRLAPGGVHFHNLHNLGAALIDEVAARGIPSWFSTHNYWLICPRAYLMTADGTICAGPGDGRRCATCTGGREPDDYARRLAEIRARVSRGVTGVLAVSGAVRRALLAAGYPAEQVDVVRQGMPHDMEIWEALGRDRAPGRVDPSGALRVAFLGSAYPHKGPQLLVEAAQRTAARVRVEIHGEVPDVFAPTLRALDSRGVVELRGEFATDELAGVLAGVDVAVLPSMWWDCAPLVAAECLAGRVPLVVPRLGGLAEAVRDGVDGLVVDPIDPGALAAALDRLATEPGLLERLQGGIEPPRAFTSYIDTLEAYYAGERPGRVEEDPEELSVWWEGDSAPRVPGRVQRPGTTDAVLPHAADVEVREGWPPAPRSASSGRLVIVQPPSAPPAPLPLDVDEVWIPDEDARGAWRQAGIEGDRFATAPSDPAARLLALAARTPRRADPAAAEPWPLAEDVELRVLATPAWRGADRLPDLLAQWCAATTPATSACLYLLADPAVDGPPEAIEQRVLEAGAGTDLDAAADVTILLEPATAERDARLHAATGVYVPLHPACAGHERIARATGGDVVVLDDDTLARRLAGASRRRPRIAKRPSRGRPGRFGNGRDVEP